MYPIIGYLIGAIPFGLVLSTLFGNGKLREEGSKNIGATNVMRTQGKYLGISTFLLDFAKGFVVCYFLHTDSEIVNLMIVMSPVIGHLFSVWLKFRGGKGVATYFGILLAIDPMVCLCTVFIWCAVFFITKISSISGLSSVIASLFFYYFVGCRSINELYILMILVTIIVVKHHENIIKLIQKREHKLKA